MRLFIATTFPAEALRDLNAKVSALRSRLPSASWVRAEAQHLTFAFLGEQDEAVINALAKPLEQALGATRKFEARIRGCGFFPNARRARVGWAGLDPETRFVDVARDVREVVTAQGIVLDNADFKPHLTLMRVRDPWPPASIELFNRTLREHSSEPFVVDRVTLYSSRLDPKGAVHTPIREFALGA